MTSSDLRVVLTLWNCGLTAREIAGRTGIPLSTVTTAVQSARARGEVVETFAAKLRLAGDDA